MARIIESRPWDDKAKEGQTTPPLTPEEFFHLHINIWGSLEFCRSCMDIVYEGECSECKEEDQGGERYRITRIPRDGAGLRLIAAHLDKLRVLGGGESSSDATTVSLRNWTISAAVNVADVQFGHHYGGNVAPPPIPFPEPVPAPNEGPDDHGF